jgi:glutamate dehydrogenase/leucine dehydrogenase
MKAIRLFIVLVILQSSLLIWLIMSVKEMQEKPSAIIKGQITVSSDENDSIEISGCTVNVTGPYNCAIRVLEPNEIGD